MIQSLDEIEKWHQEKDPWKYEQTKDDEIRKYILLSEIPNRQYNHVLDIGCGQGFITRDLPGNFILGVDISLEAVKKSNEYQNDKIVFRQGSIFELSQFILHKFDLIIVTGVLYPHYIGKSLTLIYLIIDKLLNTDGIVASVHINSWYNARFPYLLVKEYYYDYREYIHKLEIYNK